MIYIHTTTTTSRIIIIIIILIILSILASRIIFSLLQTISKCYWNREVLMKHPGAKFSFVWNHRQNWKSKVFPCISDYVLVLIPGSILSQNKSQNNKTHNR